MPVFLLDAWYAAGALLAEPVDPPPLRRTWEELRPSREVPFGRLSAPDLQALDDWLALAQILAAHDPDALERLGFITRTSSCCWRTSRWSSAKPPIPT